MGGSTERRDAAVLVGGAGFVGTATAERLCARGWDVTVVDVAPPPERVLEAGATWMRTDLLADEINLPPGEVVVLVGNGDPRTRWQWHQPLQTVVTTGRLLPALAGRSVTLCSTLEVFGTAAPPLTEDREPALPWNDEKLWRWIEHGRSHFDGPCAPWEVAAWCRDLVEADPTGRWVYGMVKRAQELLVLDAVGRDAVRVLRMANTVGSGQERVVARFARRAAADRTLQVSHPVRRSFLPVGHIAEIVAADVQPGIYVVGSPSVELLSVAEQIVARTGGGTIETTEVVSEDSCGVVGTTRLDDLGLGVPPPERWLADACDAILTLDGVRIHPPIGVVVPPRAARPDVVVERQQAALWSGAVKHGNRWSSELEDRLHEQLGLDDSSRVFATTSGTDALRLICGALCGPAREGQVAVVPSFTFPATAEVVAQLGYRVRFADIDPNHWTMDSGSLRAALAPGDVAFVLAVDTFGHPVDYPTLQQVCDEFDVPLLADSAASFGSAIGGRPIGAQALGHAFSMSFAKVLSAGGAGGAAVLPADTDVDGPFGWTRSALMNELHAVVALDQLDHLGALVDHRARGADQYAAAAARLGLGHQLVRPDVIHSWVHFVLRVPGGDATRERVAAALADLGVGTKSYFVPLHWDPAFDAVRAEGPPLPVTDELGEQCLAVPMSSELNDESFDRICATIEHVVDAV